jgi:hypothetical protein
LVIFKIGSLKIFAQAGDHFDLCLLRNKDYRHEPLVPGFSPSPVFTSVVSSRNPGSDVRGIGKNKKIMHRNRK